MKIAVSQPPLESAGTGDAAERDARAQLRLHPATDAIADVPFAVVAGGVSNHAWRADGRAADYFVRFARRGSERLGADLDNECRVLTEVAAAGLAPRIVRCDPAARILVTEWIVDGVTAATVDHDDAYLDRVARTLAALHAMTPPEDLRRVDFRAQARVLQADALTGASPRDAALLPLAAGVFDALEHGRDRTVLCHHDLHPLNVIIDRNARLWLVDWEYAGLGDAVFDLVSLASQHVLSPARRRRLFDSYRAAGGRFDDGRVDLASWAFDYVQWLWYRAAARSAGPTGDGDALRHRADSLENGLHERASGLLRCNNPGFR